jgi:hypothetical protein
MTPMTRVQCGWLDLHWFVFASNTNLPVYPGAQGVENEKHSRHDSQFIRFHVTGVSIVVSNPLP